MTTKTSENTPKLSFRQSLRRFLWPIYGKEHLKFIPMTCMISLILFNYTILRQMKDVLVTTASEGSEIIVFMKGWAVLPAAILFFIVYSKLANILSRQALFYGIITSFLAFFALFALALHPNVDTLHPLSHADSLINNLPISLKGFNNLINIYKYWTYSLFYISSELWGAVVATLLFWQFANSIIHVSEAKRFYAHFYLLASFATASSGYISKYYGNLGHLAGNYGLTVNYVMLTAIVCGLLIMLCYFIMDKYIIPDPTIVSREDIVPLKKKLKLSLTESLKFIFHSPYILWIAVLVIAYGMSIELVEVQWKNQIRLLFPQETAQTIFWGHYYTLSGLLSVFFILLGGSIIRYFGWKISALATPIIIGLTGTIFLYFVIFDQAAAPIAALFDNSALQFIVYFGVIQNVLSKGTKYALFDPTKEMSFIPLDEESKVKGKAAVDVVGTRLGKAGGGFMQQGLFIFFAGPLIASPVVAAAPYSLALLLLITAAWILAVYKLNKLFIQASKAHGEEIDSDV